MDNSIITKALLSLTGVSRKTVFKLYEELKDFQDLKLVYAALESIVGKRIEKNNSIEILKRKISITESEFKELKRNNYKIVSIFDEEYPSRFRIIDDPPVLFYSLGELEKFNNLTNIAVIGTREPTEHGKKVAFRLAVQFSMKNCNVISGLAIGCDAEAHRGSFEGKGSTLAVMPGGLDKIVPSSNKELAKEILYNGGALISEYENGSRIFKGNYIERDRLQSAFSDGVVVVETDITGGTMHTVGYTKNQEKPLGSYKHPQKYLKELKTQGNVFLINKGQAIPIRTEKDIENFIEISKKNRENLIKNKSSNNLTKNKKALNPNQISFDNFLKE